MMRNHGEQIPKWMNICQLIHTMSQEYWEATKLKRLKKIIEKDKEWEPPDSGHVKLNFDASFEGGSAFSSIVIRDANGCIL